MWKKDDVRSEELPVSTRPPLPQAEPERPATMARNASQDHAVIGRSITVRGDVTGDEDLVVQGCVEGSIDLKQHTVTVGNKGEVRANISGRIVTIEGRVVGDIDGGEQVTLRSSAYVQGDITAPRVVLENGARFRGLVDMGEVEDGGDRKGKDAEAKRTESGAGAREQGKSGASGSGNLSEGAEGALTGPTAEATANGKGKHRAGTEPEPQLAK